MEGSLEKEHGLVHRWRLTEIDPVVSDVGVGDGMIDSSSGGTNHVSGSKPTGAFVPSTMANETIIRVFWLAHFRL